MSSGNTSDILWAVLLIGTVVTAFNGDCDLLDSITTWENKKWAGVLITDHMLGGIAQQSYLKHFQILTAFE